MAKDIEQELDAIFAHHKARVAQARTEAAGKTAAEESFSTAATVCLASVITPALQQMAQALNERGVAARVPPDGGDARIDIPVSRHARLSVMVSGVTHTSGQGQTARLGGSTLSEIPLIVVAVAR